MLTHSLGAGAYVRFARMVLGPLVPEVGAVRMTRDRPPSQFALQLSVVPLLLLLPSVPGGDSVSVVHGVAGEGDVIQDPVGVARAFRTLSGRKDRITASNRTNACGMRA